MLVRSARVAKGAAWRPLRRAVTVASGQFLGVWRGVALKCPCKGIVFAGQILSAMVVRTTWIIRASRDGRRWACLMRNLRAKLSLGKRSDLLADRRGGAVSGPILNGTTRKGLRETQRIQSFFDRFCPLFSKSSTAQRMQTNPVRGAVSVSAVLRASARPANGLTRRD